MATDDDDDDDDDDNDGDWSPFQTTAMRDRLGEHPLYSTSLLRSLRPGVVHAIQHVDLQLQLDEGLAHRATPCLQRGVDRELAVRKDMEEVGPALSRESGEQVQGSANSPKFAEVIGALAQ